VLYNVGDVNFRSINTSFVERLIEQLASRADEGASLEIFLITGLLANKHDRGFGTSLAKNSLGGVLPEIAGVARGSGASKFGERPVSRDLLGAGDYG